MRLYVILPIVALMFLNCNASSSIKAQKYSHALFDAITQGRLQDLSDILNENQIDITEKLFEVEDEGTDTVISPLELAAACHNPEKMSLMIEKQISIITTDMYDIVFKSSCLECFEVLLDHSHLSWFFTRNLCGKIVKYSADEVNLFSFVSNLSKRLDFNDKLGLIESAFNSCNDQEKLFLVADAVILDIAFIEQVKKSSLIDERAATICFLRALSFKKDFDDMLPWIDLSYQRHPQTEKSISLIENYKERVKLFDGRMEEYEQPEDFIARNGIQVYLQASESFRNNNGARTLMRLLNKRNEFIWNLFEKSSYHDKIANEINISLNFAIKNNIIPCVESLLEAGFKYSESSFFDAVANNSAEIVELLLNHGAAANASNRLGDTPLILASRNGSVNIAKILLKHGAGPNIANRAGNTALIEASERGFADIAALLLSHKACPNVSNNGSETALIKAVVKGSDAVIDILLKNGAIPNVADKHRNTPLIAATMKGSADIVTILMKYGADPNFYSSDHETPLIKAIRDDLVEIVRILLDHGADIKIANKYGDTPLIIASKYSSAQVVLLLLKYKARPNDANSRRNTALIEAVYRDSFEIVELLLKHGATSNVSNIYNDTPLIAATYNCSIDIVELLLNYGADPNDTLSRKKLSLITAVEKGSVSIVKMLLNRGADPNIVDSNGYTALMIATRKGLVDIEKSLRRTYIEC